MHLYKIYSIIILIIMYVAVLNGNDMDILKKEYQDLDKLLIPACKVELATLLGEGTYVHDCMYLHYGNLLVIMQLYYL